MLKVTDQPMGYGALAQYVCSEKLKLQFSTTSRFGDPIQLYDTSADGKFIFLPRMCCPKPVDPELDTRVTGFPIKIGSKFKPRNEEQARVVSESIALLKADESHIIQAGTGFGKTVVASKIIDEIGMFTLVVCTKDDLVKQWVQRLIDHTDLTAKDIGIIQQDRCQVYGKKVVVASVQSLAIKDRYPASIRTLFGLVVFDECFPAGTMVGGREIQTLKVGDKVLSYDGNRLVRRKVKHVFKKFASQFAKVTTSEGDFVSTPNHPTFVEGVGFVPTALIQEGDHVVRLVRGGDQRAQQEDQGAVQQGSGNVLLHGTWTRSTGGDLQGEGRRVLVGVQQGARFGAHEGAEPDEGPAGSRAGVQGVVGTADALQTRWERSRTDETAAGIVRCFVGALTRDGAQDWSAWSVRAGLSALVRAGYCNTEQEALHRGRWAFAQHFEGAGRRLPEGSVLSLSRVDHIEVQERDRANELGWGVGDSAVYNLEVEGTHTYFASGLLVHNCHRLGAETFSRVASMFPSRLRLGLSATPKRVDGKEVIFFSHIGRVRVVAAAVPMSPKVMRYRTGWTCPRQKNKASGEIRRVPHQPGRCAHIFKYMVKDPVRNQLILFLAMKSYKAGRRLVIFSGIVEHLEVLELLLTKAGVPGKEIGRYYGSMSGKQLDTALACKIILATPGKMGEGTDAPWVDTCMLAMPLSNVAQIVGRILREYPEKKKPIVFDLVDDDSPVFKGYAGKRQLYYTEVKAEVVDMSSHSGAG